MFDLILFLTLFHHFLFFSFFPSPHRPILATFFRSHHLKLVPVLFSKPITVHKLTLYTIFPCLAGLSCLLPSCLLHHTFSLHISFIPLPVLHSSSSWSTPPIFLLFLLPPQFSHFPDLRRPPIYPIFSSPACLDLFHPNLPNLHLLPHSLLCTLDSSSLSPSLLYLSVKFNQTFV